MKENSIITFIIPTIGRATLDRSIESLKKQTNPNWKCIVIFDGIEKRDFEDERIQCISVPKTGLVGPKNGQSGLVRNIGIKMCDTPWIGFLDDDDSVNKDYVKTLQEKYSNFDFVIWRMKYNNGLILPPIDNDEVRFGKVGISFCFKNIFKDLLFDSNRDGEDFDLVVKLKNKTSNFKVAPEIFYNVRH